MNPFLASAIPAIPATPAYAATVFASKLIRYARSCSPNDMFSVVASKLSVAIEHLYRLCHSKLQRSAVKSKIVTPIAFCTLALSCNIH